MAKVDLTDALPNVKRPLDDRAATSAEDRILSKKLQEEYFDGTRQQGYGGYYYDGRWKPVVKRFQEYYNLSNDINILDIGCAKGFLLHDFLEDMPGVTVAGIDISDYALSKATDLVKPFICLGNAMDLPFPDDSFDLVIAINSLHNNLDRQETIQALREIERVSRGHRFVKLGAYQNEEEKARLDRWAVVSKTYLHPDAWLELFDEAGYTGDYFWFNP
jgi:SAM-dependent methyltransferase